MLSFENQAWAHSAGLYPRSQSVCLASRTIDINAVMIVRRDLRLIVPHHPLEAFVITDCYFNSLSVTSVVEKFSYTPQPLLLLLSSLVAVLCENKNSKTKLSLLGLQTYNDFTLFNTRSRFPNNAFAILYSRDLSRDLPFVSLFVGRDNIQGINIKSLSPQTRSHNRANS